MSIVSEVNRLKDAKTAIKTAIEGKGVTVPDATMLEGMAALIESIEAGGGNFTPFNDIKVGLYTPAENQHIFPVVDLTGFSQGVLVFACGISSRNGLNGENDAVASAMRVNIWNSCQRLSYGYGSFNGSYPKPASTNKCDMDFGSTHYLQAGVTYKYIVAI